jgi:uncharacterized protein YceH (UPF0502 family)
MSEPRTQGQVDWVEIAIRLAEEAAMWERRIAEKDARIAELEAEIAELVRQLETQNGIVASYRNSVIAAPEDSNDG